MASARGRWLGIPHVKVRSLMKRKPPSTKLTVAQAAKLLGMTRQGVYLAIKHQRLVASRTDGQIVIDRASVRDYRRWQREALRPTKQRKLTEAEFLQRLW